jgi:hypothetical protein
MRRGGGCQLFSRIPHRHAAGISRDHLDASSPRHAVASPNTRAKPATGIPRRTPDSSGCSRRAGPRPLRAPARRPPGSRLLRQRARRSHEREPAADRSTCPEAPRGPLPHGDDLEGHGAARRDLAVRTFYDLHDEAAERQRNFRVRRERQVVVGVIVLLLSQDHDPIRL